MSERSWLPFVACLAALATSSSCARDKSARPPQSLSPDVRGAAADDLHSLLSAATSVVEDADGTRLGDAVEVRLIKEYGDTNGTMQFVVLSLVVSGNGALVTTVDDLGEDGVEVPIGTLEAIAPQDPDAEPGPLPDVPLPVDGAVLYSESFHIPGDTDFVAVVHIHDELQVYWFADEAADDGWNLRARVQLARDASVVAR